MPDESSAGARERLRWFAAIATMVVAVVVIGFVVAGVRSSPDPLQVVVDMGWTVDEPCPDAVMIGAAGSGQGDDLLGVGPQVASAISGLGSRLAAKAQVPVVVGVAALDYPALGIVEGALLAFTGDTIVESIDQGRRELLSQIGSITSRCEALPIYLVGYSQGASVIRTALDELPVPLQGSIGGVAVIADPYRDGDDVVAAHLTDEPDKDGTDLTPHNRNGMMGSLPVPTWLDGPFYSACARQDAVCNFAFSDLLITSQTHTDETYHGLALELGALLADDILARLR